MASDNKRIVVGVDGSASSTEALRWAVRQAGFTGARVDAVIAWEFPATYGWAPVVTDLYDLEAVAGKVLSKVVDEVGGAVPVTRSVVHGNPVRVLLDAARGADLLVLGSHGHGGMTGVLLGSVSLHCLQHATCPVLVMRGDATVLAAGEPHEEV
jgi:nucleotide-binding universal stress UspA family protein